MRQNFPLRLVVIAVSVIIIIVIFGISLFAPNSKKPQSNPTNPDQVNATHPTNYIGETDLLDRGLTADQVASLKFALYKFYKDTNKSVDNITYTNVNSYHNRNSDTESDIMTFDVAIDQNTFQAKLNYSSLDSIRLYLSKSSNQIYDSGSVKIKSE